MRSMRQRLAAVTLSAGSRRSARSRGRACQRLAWGGSSNVERLHGLPRRRPERLPPPRRHAGHGPVLPGADLDLSASWDEDDFGRPPTGFCLWHRRRPVRAPPCPTPGRPSPTTASLTAGHDRPGRHPAGSEVCVFAALEGLLADQTEGQMVSETICYRDGRRRPRPPPRPPTAHGARGRAERDRGRHHVGPGRRGRSRRGRSRSPSTPPRRSSCPGPASGIDLLAGIGGIAHRPRRARPLHRAGRPRPSGNEHSPLGCLRWPGPSWTGPPSCRPPRVVGGRYVRVMSLDRSMIADVRSLSDPELRRLVILAQDLLERRGAGRVPDGRQGHLPAGRGALRQGQLHPLPPRPLLVRLLAGGRASSAPATSAPPRRARPGRGDARRRRQLRPLTAAAPSDPATRPARILWGLPDALLCWLAGYLGAILASIPLLRQRRRHGPRLQAGVRSHPPRPAAHRRPGGGLRQPAQGAAVAGGRLRLPAPLLRQPVLVFGAVFEILLTLALLPILQLDPDAKNQQLLSDLKEHRDAVTVVLFFVGAVILAPMVEELLFRGVLLRALLRKVAAR